MRVVKDFDSFDKLVTCGRSIISSFLGVYILVFIIIGMAISPKIDGDLTFFFPDRDGFGNLEMRMGTRMGIKKITRSYSGPGIVIVLLGPVNLRS